MFEADYLQHTYAFLNLVNAVSEVIAERLQKKKLVNLPDFRKSLCKTEPVCGTD